MKAPRSEINFKSCGRYLYAVNKYLPRQFVLVALIILQARISICTLKIKLIVNW